MKSRPLVYLLLAGAACALGALSWRAVAGSKVPMPSSSALRASNTRAPELSAGSAWLNTDRPLRLRDDLKGRVVLLDFWTYACINCMHAIPDLKYVEHKFAKEPFQVIGVHSAKFDEEKDAAKIDEAIGRYGIEHPVVVDSEFNLWHAYGVHGWPTLVLIDADGRIASVKSGEPDRSQLERAIAGLIQDAKSRGVAASGPLTIHRPPRADTGPLSYPGKVAALDAGRIAVSDSGHHRILLLQSDGALIAQIGSGLEGFSDGELETASFRRPQGIAGKGDILYVADTENHALRRVDLRERKVTTVAGTGRKGDGPLVVGRPPTEQALRSPWDVAWLPDGVYIAMAGSHQIWRFDPAQNRLEVVAGSGVEEITDGAGTRAALAQPSGLATDGKTLYFADSEVSAVRAVDLKTRAVHTLVGHGLFDFGDVDGPKARARLQHPLGVALLGNAVYVADTYNGKVRRVALDSGEVSSVTQKDAGALSEPGGIAAIGQKLLVADTNHHRLRWVDPKTGALSDFSLKGVSAPALKGVAERPVEASGKPESELGTAKVGRGAHQLVLTVELPEGHTFTEGAPSKAHLDLSSLRGVKAAGVASASFQGPRLVVHAPIEVEPKAQGKAAFEVALYYCREKSLCLVDRRRLLYGLSEAEVDSPRDILLTYRAPAPTAE